MVLSRKQVVIMLVALVVLSSGVFGGVYYWRNKPVDREESLGTPAPPEPILQSGEQTVAQEQESQAATTVRLLATGDMIAHDSINQNAKKSDGSYDYAALMKGMESYFEKGDVNFCNQSTPAGGASFGISGYPIFNAPIEFARGLEDVGCNLINIGTNHTNDKGQGLIDATVAAWDERKIFAVAGANRNETEQDKPRTFEVNGIKFAFVAYTDYTNKPIANNYGINRYSDSLAKEQIYAVKDDVDFVIVSMRWGTEYSPKINARQDQIAQTLANLGADVVYGHGPHVMQPVKKLESNDGRDVYVWYSLGNFLNSQLDPETLIGGFASMEIDITTKKVNEVGFMPIYQHYEWTAAQKAANDLLARKNFKMVPLDQAKDLLAKSQLKTTVEAQTERITKLLNTYTDIQIISSSKF